MKHCVYCGGRARSVDHVVPKSKGGGPSKNLVPACLACNQRKADTEPAVFFATYPECAREFVVRAPFHIPREIIELAYRVVVPEHIVGMPIRGRRRMDVLLKSVGR